MPNLNDARVKAFAIARGSDMSIDTFNELWDIIMEAIKSKKGK